MFNAITFFFFAHANVLADETITHELVKHEDIANGRPENLKKGFVNTYEAQFGYSISVGDKISVHWPGGMASNSLSVGGGAYNESLVGGINLETSVSNQYFKYLLNGTQGATVAKAVLAGVGGITDPTMYMAPASLRGAEIEVSKIKLAGTKKRPIIWMECSLVNAKDKANFSGVITISDYDAAIRMGEIYNPNFVTREIAIAKIREAKELLDLEIYTAEQFEEIKTKFAPYITSEH
jgi:hypothetical protein